MQASQGPRDLGLQLERTTLAWLRTTLTFVVGVLLVIRLIAQQHLPAAAVCTVLLLPLATTVTWFSWQRHRQVERNPDAPAQLPDGVHPAAVTALAMLWGSTGIVYVLT